MKTKLAVGVYWFSFSCNCGGGFLLHGSRYRVFYRPGGIHVADRPGLRGGWQD